jgi:hypothetical protein
MGPLSVVPRRTCNNAPFKNECYHVYHQSGLQHGDGYRVDNARQVTTEPMLEVMGSTPCPRAASAVKSVPRCLRIVRN